MWKSAAESDRITQIMADITVNNLYKSFEIGEPVLEGLSFSIFPGEHAAILGNNGCGKTTLFRILTGECDYDDGTVSVAPGKRLGLISQIPVFPEGWTTEDVLKSSKRHLDEISAQMSELEKQMETSSDEGLLKEYGRLQSEFERLGGYDTQTDINRVANGLDIDAGMRKREFENLSGGEKTRVNLARLILEDTDILLLDEPTNHLDLSATQWLEDYIDRFKGTVLVISHDRYFLDRVAQRCIEIADGKAEFYSGNYSFYAEERQKRYEEKLKRYEKDQAKLEQLQRAADQLHLWAFMGMDKLHKRAFSMEKRIEKLKTTERPKQDRKLAVKFKEAEFTGDEAVVLSHISKSYGDRVLFEDFSMELTGSESLAVIGDNGTGKTTLLRILFGEETPDSGWTYLGPQIKAAYLPQTVRFEDESRTVLETMMWEGKCQQQEARSRLAAFGFRGEPVFNCVANLSGGERSRLKLCMLMGGNINLLVLDEPTNHLDIASREWIEDALSDYDKTLIFVTHDRYFADRFATRVLSFDGGKSPFDYKGTYREYLEYKEREKAFAIAAPKPAPKEKPAAKPKNTQGSVASTEKKIEKLEKQKAEIAAEMDLNASDYVKLMELDAQSREIDSQLEELYELWEKLQS